MASDAGGGYLGRCQKPAAGHGTRWLGVVPPLQEQTTTGCCKHAGTTVTVILIHITLGLHTAVCLTFGEI